MKRLSAIILALTMFISLCACAAEEPAVEPVEEVIPQVDWRDSAEIDDRAEMTIGGVKMPVIVLVGSSGISFYADDIEKKEVAEASFNRELEGAQTAYDRIEVADYNEDGNSDITAYFNFNDESAVIVWFYDGGSYVLNDEFSRMPGAMTDAYKIVLQNLVNDNIWPDGTESGYDDTFGAPEGNSFALCDVDGDGSRELIVRYVTAPSAGMTEAVLGYNAIDGVFFESTSFPGVSYYDNGTIKAGWSHGSVLCSMDCWPFDALKYDGATDTYSVLASVDTWDRRVTTSDSDGTPFPAKVKSEAAFFVTENGETTTMDEDEFSLWFTDFFGANEIIPEFVNMTEENINNLK